MLHYHYILLGDICTNVLLKTPPKTCYWLTGPDLNDGWAQFETPLKGTFVHFDDVPAAEGKVVDSVESPSHLIKRRRRRRR